MTSRHMRVTSSWMSKPGKRSRKTCSISDPSCARPVKPRAKRKIAKLFPVKAFAIA